MSSPDVMYPDLVRPELPRVSPADPVAAVAPMTAHFIDGCFAWLHQSPRSVRGDVAILLCPALNRDALDSHYSLRLLADDFAQAGYPTLRLDYPGTGDSREVVDTEGQPCDHWAAWRHSLHQAADWLRETTGARRLVLCGLRIGATLATLVAQQRDDIAGLMLIAPVLRGHSYMRQLAIEAKLLNGGDSDQPGGLDFQELHFSAETVQQIAKADLRTAALSASHEVAVFSQSESTLLETCVQAWTRRGARILSAGFEGLEPLLHHNVQGEGQPADFAALLDWIQRAVPVRPLASPRPHARNPVLSHTDWTEQPLAFGPGERLFGMLCRPMRPASGLTVIIANTGVDPHYGVARFGVEFARRLACEGIASLRIDFAGLGDSAGPSGKERMVSSLFETDRSANIRSAMDRLEQEGYRRFAVQGLCSGAFHALRGGLADARIEMLMLVNMPVFTWRQGDTVDFVGHKHAAGDYLGKLKRKETWQQLLRGKIDVLGILIAQGERLGERARARAKQLARRFGIPAPLDFPHQALATLSARGARVLFLYGAEDGGLDVVEQHFGKSGRGLHAFDGVELQVTPKLDHSLNTSPMRRIAADRMVEFTARYPASIKRPSIIASTSAFVVR